MLDLLRVVGRQPDEDDHPGIGGDIAQPASADEDIDHRGDDDPDESHREQAPELRQVSLGRIADHRHSGKGPRRDEEGRRQRTQLIDEEDGAKRQAVQRSVDGEAGRSYGHAHLLDARGEEVDQHQL